MKKPSRYGKTRRWNSSRPMICLRYLAFNKTGLESILPRSPATCRLGDSFFDDDTVTDYYERDIAAELIRESVLMFVRDEVPHCVAVQIDTYEERGEDRRVHRGTFFVERDSQKGIIIGKGGEMIKKIGTRARQEIESMSGRKVFLSLKSQGEQELAQQPGCPAICWVTLPTRKTDQPVHLGILRCGRVSPFWIGLPPGKAGRSGSISPNRPPCSS